MGFWFGSFAMDAIALIATLVCVLYAYFKYKYTYWQRKGLKTPKPKMPFGNFKGVLTVKHSFGDDITEVYKEMRATGEKHAGLYVVGRPVYMPMDPEICKSILTKDFNVFVDRSLAVDEEREPLSGHLFSLKGQKWKTLRGKLTPTFTSGKMKMMFPTMVDCSHGLKDILNDLQAKKTPADVKEIMARFTTDVIGSCAFGIDCNSLKDPNTDFRKYGRRVFEPTFLEAVYGALNATTPDLAQFLRMPIVAKDVSEFFMNIVKETIQFREKNNVDRKDFMNLLLQIKNYGRLRDEGVANGDHDSKAKNGVDQTITVEEIAAQSFLFFAAGFETSSTTLQFCMYELSQNAQLQDKLREEILRVMKKHNGQLTYDAIMEMTYMDNVVSETLRKYPPVPLLNRLSRTEYKVPGTDLTLEKDTLVFVPCYPMQMDDEYFPNPNKFDPERFSEEQKSTRHPYAYLPFGEGPRNCIGMRFGLMQTKVGLAVLLSNFKYTLSDKTPKQVQFEPKSFILSPKQTIYLNVHKL